MRKTISIVALVILLLTSCSPAQPLPTPTDVPTRTATATPTSLPTATPQPTHTPKPTATATMIGPSTEVLNQILQEAGVSFSPDTTNEILDEKGNERCKFGYSNGVLINSQINYIQYPDTIKDYICYNVWGKLMMLQRTNAPYLTEEFGKFPILASEQTMEIQSQMRDSAKNILDKYNQLPFTYWTPNGESFTNDISDIELNHVSKAEYLKLIQGLDSKGLDYSTFPYYELTEEDNKWNAQDTNMVVFFKDNKLMAYLYNFGGRLDNAPGGITDPRWGYTALEQMQPKERAYMYMALIEDYNHLTSVMKMLTVPADQLGIRWEEVSGGEFFDNVFGFNSGEIKANADQTLSPLYKPTPTPSPTP